MENQPINTQSKKQARHSSSLIITVLVITLIVSCFGFLDTHHVRAINLYSELPTPTTTASPYQLQSKFLKDDVTAQGIVTGNIDSVDMRTSALFYGQTNLTSTNTFAFRFMSALRMLGYIIPQNVTGGEYPGIILLNRFQSFNQLPKSNLIDLATLKVVDQKLAARENLDNSLAPTFPLLSHMITAPLNEPPKNHSAALFAIPFRELPASLVPWNEQYFEDFFSNQQRGDFDGSDLTSYKICDAFLYTEISDKCIPSTKIYSLVNDDFADADVTLHEYAHFIDKNIYVQGLINTSSFYDISYDTSRPVYGGYGVNYPLRRGDAAKTTEFVSGYAVGYLFDPVQGAYSPYEDFAESFDMYVSQGVVFRKLAESMPILRQKYDWLKSNVFNNVEYNSGTTDSITYLQKAFNRNTAPYLRDYAAVLPNFVWNYQFKNGSVSFPPSAIQP